MLRKVKVLNISLNTVLYISLNTVLNKAINKAPKKLFIKFLIMF